MISDGSTVFWTQRDYSGNAVRVLRTRTVGQPFPIERSSGGSVVCCRLEINRLARLEDLSTAETPQPKRPETIAPPKTTEKRPTAAHAPAPKQPAPLQKPPQSENRKLQTENAAESRCNVLAIDFLNVLVRAFHAGKPTETHAVRSLFQTTAAAIRKLKPAHVVFALDGGHKRRSQLLPAYKAHRPPSDPLLTAQKKLAEDALYICGFDLIRIDDWEADDVLATLATNYTDTVIASCDKDLLTMTHSATRCRIYHPWGAGEFMTADEKLGIPAHQVTDYLSLCGDTSDGIPGVKGIGAKTAAALLAEFDSLEAIIVAAKLGNIKGANGKKIAKQAQAALLCRKVVELNARLALPELHGFQPHPDWRHELQNMRLGSCAAIMETLQSERFTIRANGNTEEIHPPVRETASATTEQVEPVERDSTGTLGFPVDATAFDQRREEATPPAAERPRTNSTEDNRNDCGSAVQGVSSAGDGNFVTRSITEPIRRNLTYDERFNRPDNGLIAYWEAGRESAASNRNENPWRKGTNNHTAWQQGFEGYDLSVSLTEPTPKPAAKPKPQATGSLF